MIGQPPNPAMPKTAVGPLLYYGFCASAAAMVLAGIFLWLQRSLEDGVFAFLLTLMFPITLLPWILSGSDRRRA